MSELVESGRQRGTVHRARGSIRRDIAAVVGLGVLAVVLSRAVSDYWAQQLSLWVIYGMLAVSLTFIWGKAGIFSFGQSAFFGIGAYCYGVAAIDLSPQTNESVSAVAIGVLIAAAAAGLVGYFIFYGNVSDARVAIITLAFSLVLYTVMSTTAGPEYHIGVAQLGGYNGLIGMPPLTYGRPGGIPTLVGLQDYLALMVVVALVVTFGLRWILRRPFGRIIVALRANEERTELLGFDVRAHKLGAFMLGGAIAGLAGAFYAAWGTFVDPSVFALQQAAFVVIWVLLGGHTSLLGAFVGVAFVQELSAELGSTGSTATPIVLGSILIAVVLFLPRGLVPSLFALTSRLKGRGLAPDADSAPLSLLGSPVALLAGAPEDAGIQLGVRGVRKVFDGVAAVDGVDLTFPPRGVECLIGPNGAGKSTLFGLLSGRHRPTAGQVTLDGESIERQHPHDRARRGIGIKLQIASLFEELSARENVWLAAYARHRDAGAADARADAVLSALDLSRRGAEPAAALSHGEQQWLEIGMVVAGDPKVILLDEPTAGMSRQETARMAEVVRALGEQAAVVVVEHDMEFVRILDVPVTVLHEGKIFAKGSLAQLRDDGRVLDIYLGRAHAEA